VIAAKDLSSVLLALFTGVVLKLMDVKLDMCSIPTGSQTDRQCMELVINWDVLKTI
jgi:hypothetical protein